MPHIDDKVISVQVGDEIEMVEGLPSNHRDMSPISKYIKMLLIKVYVCNPNSGEAEKMNGSLRDH